MFILKKKYFFIIGSIKDIDLNNIKKYNKFSIIYRNKKTPEDLNSLLIFRKKCRLKNIKFYIANNTRLACLLKADGIYLSASNKSFKSLNLLSLQFDIIGSAHNINEINQKKKQKCTCIIFTKLFKVNYAPEEKFLGIIKFNNLLKINRNIIPLGGITEFNLNKLNILKSDGFALMSEIKKKPTISSRLF